MSEQIVWLLVVLVSSPVWITLIWIADSLRQRFGSCSAMQLTGKKRWILALLYLTCVTSALIGVHIVLWITGTHGLSSTFR
jgi:hypothetical protein